MDIESFKEYFEYLYIGKYNNNFLRLKDAIFDIEILNVNYLVCQNLLRTINNLESGHRVLNQKIGVVHPNIAHLLKTLMDDEEIQKFNMLRALSGKFELTKKDLKKMKGLKFL